MRRLTLRPIALALAALAFAALACSEPLEEGQAITPSATSALPPTSVIALPSATPALPSPSPQAVVIATSIIAPTTVLGATMTPEPVCTNNAEFLTDVTIPDGTSIVPGAAFDKIWQIKNTGTCAWDGSYHLKQTSNTSVQAITRDIPLPPVEPGATIEIGIKATLSADTPPGAKSAAKFELRDPADKKFGTTLTIVVVAVLEGTEQGSTGGTISGTVWHDFCHPGNAEGGGEPDGGHCAIAADGSKVADGIFQADEKGIAGVKVELHLSTCTGALVATVTTDAKGAYAFTSLSDGQYCVSINALDASNASIFIPGAWTSPATNESTTALGVTLVAGQSAQKNNFGWDFQFD